jgi:hypothetical protein
MAETTDKAGKEDCIILDHAANSLQHGLVSEITSYKLDDGDLIGPSNLDKRPCKSCPICNSVVALNTRSCPECDYSFELNHRLPESVPGELVELVMNSPGSDSRNGFDATQPDDLVDGAQPHLNTGSPYPLDFLTSPPMAQGPQRIEGPMKSASAAPSLGPSINASKSDLSESYRNIISNLKRPSLGSDLLGLRKLFGTLRPSDKFNFIQEGLFSDQPELWLEHMSRAGCMMPIGLGCLETLREFRVNQYKGLTHF